MSFKFIDLFAGIGGFHLALSNLGGECVFASESDRFARQTYEHNFRKTNPDLFDRGFFNADVREAIAKEIPDFDLLCAGFPCQPFSQAGFKKGFQDDRGTLFFDIARILDVKRPDAYILENVRGLIKHDSGNTFKTIEKVLVEELGYSFQYQVCKASDYGLPQHRPRVFMVGFREPELAKRFSFPPKRELKFNMSDVWGGKCDREIGFTLRVGGRGSSIGDRHNWDSYLVDGQIKKLTYKEAKLMQGFPEHFEFPVSPTQAIKQLGNSVAVDVVEAIAEKIIGYRL